MAAPGRAAADSFQSEPAAAQGAVCLHGFQKVGGTGRLKPAAARRAAEKRKHGRDQNLVAANQASNKQAHQGARIEARSARRNQSCSSCRLVAPAADGRAISTSQIPARILCWCVRTVSRRRRRTRLRTTAPPTRFDVTKPARNAGSSATARTPSTRVPPRWVAPSAFTCAKSPGRTSRFVFGKVNILRTF